MDAEALEIINRQNRRRMHSTKFSAEDDVADITRQIEMRHRMESSVHASNALYWIWNILRIMGLSVVI